MKSRLLLAAVLILAAFSASAQPHPQDEGYNFVQNISYTSTDETDSYRNERCKLDIYYPETDKGFATLVWFHGGGLEKGSKNIPEGFRRQGFAVVSVNYRLFPKCKCPDYIDDAAMAVAWVFANMRYSRTGICIGSFSRRLSYPDGGAGEGIYAEIWRGCG